MDDYERNMHLRELEATGPSSHNTHNADSWSSKGSVSHGKADRNHPLALHNLPTGSADHHEHAPDGIAGGESVSGLQKTSSNLQHTRHRLGLHPSAPIFEEHDLAAHSDWWWPRVRMTLKEPFAEFFGVFIMVLFGDGSVAQVLLSHGAALQPTTAPGMNGFGDYQSISWGWGLGVMLGIYVAGDSGAYLK